MFDNILEKWDWNIWQNWQNDPSGKTKELLFSVTLPYIARNYLHSHMGQVILLQKLFFIIKIKNLVMFDLSMVTFQLFLLTVYGIGKGWYHLPPNCRKIREKNGKRNQHYFLQVSSKSSWTTDFRNFFNSGGLSRDYYWRGDIHEIYDSWGFLRISQQIFINFLLNLLGSKILPISCSRHQKFDHECPVTLGRRL